MQEIFFDEHGFLKPYEVLDFDLKTFSDTFVINEQRKRLFENYMNYTTKLCSVVSNSIYQWIDGSFVSKKENHRDIDFVTFIDSNTVFENKNKLKNFLYPLSKKLYGVDAYIVKVFPLRFIKQNIY